VKAAAAVLSCIANAARNRSGIASETETADKVHTGCLEKMKVLGECNKALKAADEKNKAESCKSTRYSSCHLDIATGLLNTMADLSRDLLSPALRLRQLSSGAWQGSTSYVEPTQNVVRASCMRWRGPLTVIVRISIVIIIPNFFMVLFVTNARATNVLILARRTNGGAHESCKSS
jgi:hypothetical protein